MARTIRLVRQSDGAVICQGARVARSFAERLAGLALRASMLPEDGLWLLPCNGVHTALMRFSIDVVALDKDLRVLAIHTSVRPWRLLPPRPGWHSTLELPAGAARRSGLALRDRLSAEPAP